jgi:hypothetical protein
LGDTGTDTLAGAVAVAFEPELTLERAEDRLDPLPASVAAGAR